MGLPGCMPDEPMIPLTSWGLSSSAPRRSDWIGSGGFTGLGLTTSQMPTPPTTSTSTTAAAAMMGQGLRFFGAGGWFQEVGPACWSGGGPPGGAPPQLPPPWKYCGVG